MNISINYDPHVQTKSFINPINNFKLGYKEYIKEFAYPKFSQQ